jgi:XTP/dITP diphosphohydrolase
MTMTINKTKLHKNATKERLISDLKSQKKRSKQYKKYIRKCTALVNMHEITLAHVNHILNKFSSNIVRAWHSADSIPMWLHCTLYDMLKLRDAVHKYYNEDEILTIKQKELLRDLACRPDLYSSESSSKLRKLLYDKNIFSSRGITVSKKNADITSITIATGNKAKAAEILKLAESYGMYKLFESKTDIPVIKDMFVGENKDTYAGNAIKKAKEVSQATGGWALADDSGLEITDPQFSGFSPGVKSSRYAGLLADDDKNMDLLISRLWTPANHPYSIYTPIAAEYKCTLAIAYNGQLINTFTGSLPGRVTHRKCGNNGFGYDKIFIPEGFNLTLAQMDLKDVIEISHRAMAFKRFMCWWKQYSFKDIEK